MLEHETFLGALRFFSSNYAHYACNGTEVVSQLRSINVKYESWTNHKWQTSRSIIADVEISVAPSRSAKILRRRVAQHQNL